MAEDAPPSPDEDWLEADQPGRPFGAQIHERRRSIAGAAALALLGASVIAVAGLNPVAMRSLRSSPTPPGASGWMQPLRYVTSVDFFSPTDGVVLTNLTHLSRSGLNPQAQSLLATRDGGGHWRDITPATAGSVGCCAAFFLDPSHGWAVGGWGYGSSALRVFRTIDGGATWAYTDISGAPYWAARLANGCCPSLDFVDSQHGWLVFGSESTQRFLRTIDGGASWTDLPSLPGPALGRTLILRPSVSPLRFVSPSTGWFVAVTDTFADLDEQLYVTRDGGTSWREQDVPLPPAYPATEDVYVGVPTFTDRGEGILPVSLADGSAVYFDISADGGATWSYDGARGSLFLLAGEDSQAWTQGAPVSVGHGIMAVVVGVQLQINSGSGWTVVAPFGLPPGAQRIQFIDQRVGWAIAPDGFVNVSDLLFKTIDGGSTWTRVGG